MEAGDEQADLPEAVQHDRDMQVRPRARTHLQQATHASVAAAQLAERSVTKARRPSAGGALPTFYHITPYKYLDCLQYVNDNCN